MRREKIGVRQHRATVSQHDGTVDTHGNPTYSTSGDWDVVVTDWPVEMLAVNGGESLRGRQVTDATTHVLYGEYHGGSSIIPEMKCVINSVIYQVVSVLDMDGMSRELRVEVKRETT